MKAIQNIYLKGVLLCTLFLFSINAWQQGSTLIYFDGVDDYVETNHYAINGIWYDFTLEAVISGVNGAQGDDPTIFSNRWSPIKGNTVFLKGNGEEPRLLCFSHGNDEYYIPGNGSFDGNLLDGECHHIAVVKEDHNISFYIDGVNIGTLVNPYYYCENLNGINSIWIGRDHYYDNPFRGTISEVRVWDIARNAYDISENMDGSLTGLESGFEGYWKLKEGIGQDIKEQTSEIWSGFLGESPDSDDFDPEWSERSCDKQSVNLEDNSVLSELSVYPNPVICSILNIDLGTDLTNVSLVINTLSGQNVLQTSTFEKTSQIKLDVGHISTGIYILEISHSTGFMTEKIVFN